MLCHLKEEMGIRSTSTLTLHNATIKYWGRNANNIYVIETVGQGMGAGDWVGCTLNHLRSDPPTTPAPFFFCLQIQFDPQRNPLTLIQSKWGTERVKELKYYKKNSAQFGPFAPLSFGNSEAPYLETPCQS